MWYILTRSRGLQIRFSSSLGMQSFLFPTGQQLRFADDSILNVHTLIKSNSNRLTFASVRSMAIDALALCEKIPYQYVQRLQKGVSCK